MKKKSGEKAQAAGRAVLFCLGACIALMACPSNPSRSGSSSSGKDEAAVAERKIEHIEGLLARRPVAGRVIEDLMSALPDRVRLTEVSYDSGKVRVKGIAPSNNLLADYIARLGDNPSLADLSARRLRHEDDQGPGILGIHARGRRGVCRERGRFRRARPVPPVSPSSKERSRLARIAPRRCGRSSGSRSTRACR